jgi:hypothetical protein
LWKGIPGRREWKIASVVLRFFPNAMWCDV